MSEHQSNDRENDPIARDIDEREADSGDIVAGEQVLDEGRVSPSQDDFAEGEGASGAHGVDDDEATSDDLKHAADERQDAGAPPPQPEAPG